MTDWGSLRDAYGPADGVGALLERAESDDRAVWDELWSRLCHQGTVYSASYAALPHLTRLAGRRAPAGYVEPLALACAILASEDGPEDSSTVRSRYPEITASLNRMALANVPLAASPVELIYAVQTLLATEESTPWATRLEAVADQELEMACPQCGEQLMMNLELPEAKVAMFNECIGPTVVLPAVPSALVGAEARAYGVAASHAHPEVAPGFLNVFGQFECPSCAYQGTATQALAKRHDP